MSTFSYNLDTRQLSDFGFPPREVVTDTMDEVLRWLGLAVFSLSTWVTLVARHSDSAVHGKCEEFI
jgi:hypothetical protein